MRTSLVRQDNDAAQLSDRVQDRVQKGVFSMAKQDERFVAFHNLKFDSLILSLNVFSLLITVL